MDDLSVGKETEQKVEHNNPLKEPFQHIVWGFALTFLTFQFVKLQYLLPLIGVYEFYVGFRMLKKENVYFHTAWLLAIGKLILNLCSLIVEVTPLRIVQVNLPIGYVNVVLYLLLLAECRRALREFYHKNEVEQSRDPFLWAIIWEIVIFFCAVYLPESGLLVAIVFLLWMISILCSIAKIPEDFDQEREMKCDTSVKPMHPWSALLYFGGCIGILGITCFFVNHHAAKFEPYIHQPLVDQQLSDQLIRLSFSAELLQMLPKETLEQFQDAVAVEHCSDLLRFGQQGLNMNTVFVELPDKDVYTIVYFRWGEGGSYWNDGFRIHLGNLESEVEIVEDALLYSKGGKMYRAKMPRVTQDIYTGNGWFGTTSSYQIRGGVSFPFGAQKQSGYLIYHSKYHEDTVVSHYVNYYHKLTLFQIPYQLPEEEEEDSNVILQQHSAHHFMEKK